MSTTTRAGNGQFVSVDDKKWRKLIADIAGIDKRIAKVGVMSSETIPDGLSLVDLAAIHEFGTDTLPERSFIRSTFERESVALGRICERAAKAIVTKDMPVDQALELIGAWGAAQVKRSITAGLIEPADAPSTIARKGSSKVLVDTGQLVNAITYVVGAREP